MKKYLCFLLTISICTATNAQLKVVSNGNILIGDTAYTPNSKLAVNYPGDGNFAVSLKGTTHGLRSYRSDLTTSHGWGCGIDGCADIRNTEYAVGVKAIAKNYGSVPVTTGRAYGIFSQVQDGQNGYNYAVFANLMGDRNGAAVYGSSVNGDAGFDLGNRYAGYFVGNTKVLGTLEATSTNFNLMVSPANPNNAEGGIVLGETRNDDGQEISDKLSALSVIAYRKSGQRGTTKTTVLNTENLDDASSSTKTVEQEVEIPKSKLELQCLERCHYGIDVEQLQDNFPELVYDMEDGTKGINYMEMIPLLLQSINELKAEIASLKKGNSTVSKAKEITAVANIEEEIEMLCVSQNKPNPFTDKTTIELSIPESVSKASLFIYDMNGKQIDRIDITDRDTTNVSITSEGLNEGMYLYSLIADGKIVSTKRMILTK